MERQHCQVASRYERHPIPRLKSFDQRSHQLIPEDLTDLGERLLPPCRVAFAQIDFQGEPRVQRFLPEFGKGKRPDAAFVHHKTQSAIDVLNVNQRMIGDFLADAQECDLLRTQLQVLRGKKAPASFQSNHGTSRLTIPHQVSRRQGSQTLRAL
jgi:hypothetical protein